MGGPLSGVRVIELAGLGAAPFACMLLADLGADVIRIDRPGGDPQNTVPSALDVLGRSRRSIAIDLKSPQGREAALRLVEEADVIVEGFRPGVMDRLGLSFEVCRSRNPKIIVGRMTGWGQDGPNALLPGHDINYIAVAGALAHVGRANTPPTPPLSLVGDFGGGGVFLAFGIVAALLEAGRSGQGQVVDAAMVDGAASLMTLASSLSQAGMFDEERRGENMIDGGAHFYDSYECADGRYVCLGAIEPQFYRRFLELMGLDNDDQFLDQLNKANWPLLRERLRSIFLQKTRADWCALLEQEQTCFSPVLTMTEARTHPHNLARGTFVEIGGIPQPSTAPRFSRTSSKLPTRPAEPGEHTRQILATAGYGAEEISILLESGAVAEPLEAAKS